MQNRSKRVPSEKVRLLWLVIHPFERGDLSCRRNCRGVRLLLVHSLSRVLANPMIMNKKRMGGHAVTLFEADVKGYNRVNLSYY